MLKSFVVFKVTTLAYVVFAIGLRKLTIDYTIRPNRPKNFNELKILIVKIS